MLTLTTVVLLGGITYLLRSVIEDENVILHGVCEPQELYVEGRRSIPQAIYFAVILLPTLLREDFDIIGCQEFPYFLCFSAKLHELLHNSTVVIAWYEYLGRKGIFGKVIEQATLRLASTIIPISVVFPKIKMSTYYSRQLTLRHHN